MILYLLHCGPPWTAREQSASPWSSSWTEVQSWLWCPEHLLPPFFTDLGVFRDFSLTSSHYPLLLQNAPMQFYFSFLWIRYPRCAMTVAERLSICQCRVHLTAGSIRHRGSFWHLLIEATPVAPPVWKPSHANPVHMVTRRKIKHMDKWSIFSAKRVHGGGP